MLQSRQFLHYFILYLLYFLIYTCSYSHSLEDAANETSSTEMPTEEPEPVEENYDVCGIPYLGGEAPQPVPENLVQMGPNSKYFYFYGVDSVPIKEVAALCETIGLQPAEVRNNIELLTIEMQFVDSGIADFVVSLGINDEVKEGAFVEHDGTPMQFHSFDAKQPNNKMNAESCVAVSENRDLGRLVYNDVSCDTGVIPMCMFKATSKCFTGNPITLARVKTGFELVGSSDVRDYYVAHKQYTRAEAVSVCGEAGYKLVDFSTGLSNNQMLYDLTKKWQIRNYIFQAIPFWTGGKILAKDTVKPDLGEAGTVQYKFENSEKMLNDLSDWPSLGWDEAEPSDASGIGLEECISAILYKPYQASGDNVFTLATTNCRLPQYPLCYEEKSVEPVNVTLNATTEAKNGTLGARSGFDEDEDERRPGRFCTIEDIKVNLSSPQLTTEELLNLTAATRHKPLSSDDYRIKWAVDQPWMINFTEKIFEIPKEFCPSSFLPSEYINMMHNLLILYYNAIKTPMEQPSDGAQKFLKEQTMLFEKCSKNLKPLRFDSAGGLPTFLGSRSIIPIEEVVEVEDIVGGNYVPDMIIDSFWYFFQITIAACWKETKPGGFPSRTFNLQRLHYLFTTYFLEVFQQRWFSSKTKVDYGVMMGDMDIDSAYYSMKSCAIAAFITSNITELYFPRPVYISDPSKTSEIFNEKLQDMDKPQT